MLRNIAPVGGPQGGGSKVFALAWLTRSESTVVWRYAPRFEGQAPELHELPLQVAASFFAKVTRSEDISAHLCALGKLKGYLARRFAGRLLLSEKEPWGLAHARARALDWPKGTLMLTQCVNAATLADLVHKEFDAEWLQVWFASDVPVTVGKNDVACPDPLKTPENRNTYRFCPRD